MPLFEGILTAAVTPSRTNDLEYEMDMAAALEVIDFLGSHAISGIAIFGATGEFPHFTVEDRMRFTHMAVKRSRVPVIVNVTHSTYEAVERMAEDAIDCGATAIMAQPPHYFRYGAGEIRAFYEEIVTETGGRLPFYLYNLPAFNNPIPIEVATELLLSGQFAGIKDSSGDPVYLRGLFEAKAKREFNLILGHDALFTHGRKAGAHGVISGCACAIPEAMLALDRAIAAGNAPRIRKLDQRLTEFMEWIMKFPGPYGIREALSVRGLPMGQRAIPFAKETEQAAADFRDWFKGWLGIVQREAQEQ